MSAQSISVLQVLEQILDPRSHRNRPHWLTAKLTLLDQQGDGTLDQSSICTTNEAKAAVGARRPLPCPIQALWSEKGNLP